MTASSHEAILRRAEESGLPRLARTAREIRARLARLDRDTTASSAKAAAVAALTEAKASLTQAKAALAEAQAAAVAARSAPTGLTGPETDAARIRAWAVAHNIGVPPVGRIPHKVRAQYEAAHTQ